MESNARHLFGYPRGAPLPLDGFGTQVVARPERRSARGLPSDRSPSRVVRDAGSRLLNIVVALIGLVVAAPLVVVIALAIKLTSRGPVLYSQNRVGLDRRAGRSEPPNVGRRRSDIGGRVFTIYKFRTMRADSDQAAEVWCQENDPRITPVGRVLRKYRLDELPQLVNVIKGDMNIVGPRPEQPAIFQELRQKVEGYHRRQKVLPGITGWAQVNQHYDRCIEDVRNKVQLDLEYIERRSPSEDLKIMLKTVPVVVLKKGAQ